MIELCCKNLSVWCIDCLLLSCNLYLLAIVVEICWDYCWQRINNIFNNSLNSVHSHIDASKTRYQKTCLVRSPRPFSNVDNIYLGELGQFQLFSSSVQKICFGTLPRKVCSWLSCLSLVFDDNIICIFTFFSNFLRVMPTMPFSHCMWAISSFCRSSGDIV